MSDGRIIVDHVITICNGCHQQRTIYPDRPLHGAEELIAWMHTKIPPCACGARTGDVKAHLKKP